MDVVAPEGVVFGLHHAMLNVMQLSDNRESTECNVAFGSCWVV